MQIKLKTVLFLGAFLMAMPVHGDDFNPAGVIVESLPELSLNTIGTQPTSNPALWSGTSAEKLLSLIERVGKSNLSPAERQFVVRLLTLDIAGGGFDDSNRILGESVFLRERLRALFHLGEWDTVLKMIALVPENDMTDEIRQIKINTLLMKGDVKEACNMVSALESSVYADKMNISCFVAQEQKEKAVLSYDIYQENTPETETLFTALAENALREIPTDLPDNAILEPTDIYLLSLNKNASIDWTKQNRAMKITMADLPTTDIARRISLGEQSGLSAEAMKKLYRLPLFDADLKNPVINRASLHQRILATADERQKAILLKEFITSARQDNVFINVAPVIAEIFNTMEASADKIDLAFDAVQVYALTDNLALSETWFEVLDDSDVPLHKKQTFLLLPLRQAMGAGSPADIAEGMHKYCSVNPISACEQIRLFEPVTDETTFLSAPDIVTDNVVVDKSVDSTRTTRLGETLLQAVLDIQNGQNLKKSYNFIREVGHPQSGAAILIEGMIFE